MSGNIRIESCTRTRTQGKTYIYYDARVVSCRQTRGKGSPRGRRGRLSYPRRPINGEIQCFFVDNARRVTRPRVSCFFFFFPPSPPALSHPHLAGDHGRASGARRRAMRAARPRRPRRTHEPPVGVPIARRGARSHAKHGHRLRLYYCLGLAMCNTAVPKFPPLSEL